MPSTWGNSWGSSWGTSWNREVIAPNVLKVFLYGMIIQENAILGVSETNSSLSGDCGTTQELKGRTILR